MFQGDKSEIPTNMILALKAKKLLEKGCQGYLMYIINRDVELVVVQMILVLREFQEVFLKKLPSLPLKRKVEFSIELAPSTNPIFIAPYRIAPIELRELKA